MAGQTEWWLLPTVAATVFGQVLAASARDVGAGSEAIHPLFLPSYSPELQPAGYPAEGLGALWPLTNEPLANKHVPDFATLEKVQARRCLTPQQQPEIISDHTRFDWWPSDA